MDAMKLSLKNDMLSYFNGYKDALEKQGASEIRAFTEAVNATKKTYLASVTYTSVYDEVCYQLDSILSARTIQYWNAKYINIQRALDIDPDAANIDLENGVRLNRLPTEGGKVYAYTDYDGQQVYTSEQACKMIIEFRREFTHRL